MEYALYSCGDCAVLQHDPSKLEDNARDIANVIRLTNKIKGKLPGRSEISWKPDYSVMALGNEDGTIEVFRAPHLQLLCSVQVHRKLVNCVRWHPEYTAQSVEPSRCQFWIASGSNEAIIQVTDLRKAIELCDVTSSGEQMVVTESFCQLEGHTNRITGLCWSPHTDGLLVSASYDWTAQVWDVKTCEPIANYRAHHGRLLCTLWSALDPDLVYTGGDDFTAQGWKISQQTHKSPPVGSEKRKHKNKSKGAKHNIKQSPDPKSAGHVTKTDQPESLAVTSIDSNDMGDVALAEIQALLDKKKAELQEGAEEDSFTVTSSCGVSKLTESPEGAHLEPVSSTNSYPKPIDSTPTKRDGLKRDLKDKTKRKTRSLFPLSSTMDNRGKLHTQDDCVHLIQTKAQDPVPLLPSDQCHLGHFLDRKNAYQLFDQEIGHHLDQGNWDQYMILETFKGNPGESVRTLTDKRELNDFTVALSAMASPKVWRATCKAYAVQLEKEGNYPKAASYLLAVHEVYDAIDMLRRNGHYKDALCLARVRLSPEDPVIKSLYSSWGYQLASDGNFELSAKCFIGNGQPLEAAKLLARRADISALRVASEICIGCQNMTNAKIYCHKFVQQCMLNLDWAGGAQLVKMNEALKINGLLLMTHQSLLQQLHLLGYVGDMDVDKGDPYTEHIQNYDKTTMPWLLLNTSDMKSWLPWQAYTVEGEVFVHHLIRQWCSVWGVNMERDELERLDHELTTLSHTRQAHSASKQILIEITCHVTLATVKLLLGRKDDAAYWMTVAMAMCHDNQLDGIWEGLCRLLLPTGAGRFVQLCHEVRALRLSAISQEPVDIEQVVTSQREASSNPGHPGTKSNSLNIYNSSEHCSAVDCLQAFYNLRVLKYYLAQCNHQTTSPGQGVKLESPVKLKASTAHEPSVSCVRDLSYSLLWDSQILKLKLQDTLLLISKATAMLINQHGTSQSESSSIAPNIDCDVEQTLVYPVTPEIRNVSLSAFQKENRLIMDRLARSEDTMVDLNPLLSLDNLDGELLPQRQDSEEYVKMRSVKVGNGDGSMNVSGISAMDDVTNGTSVDDETVNSATETKVTSTNSSPDKDSTNKHPAFNVEIPEVDKLGKHYQIYPNIPEEWYTLPIEDRYTQNYVDLRVLSMEQAFTQNELTQLSQQVKNIPFPNPEVSAKLLTRLSRHLEEGEQLTNTMITWARRHCYTNNAIDFFSTLPNR